MDNNMQQPVPPTPVVSTPPVAAPVAPEAPQAQPSVPQPLVQTPYAPESSGKSPLLYVGLFIFFLILGGATYYLLQPSENATSAPTTQSVTYTSPAPTVIPTLSEQQEFDTAIDYSIDDSFEELEKDLQQL